MKKTKPKFKVWGCYFIKGYYNKDFNPTTTLYIIDIKPHILSDSYIYYVENKEGISGYFNEETLERLLH